MKINNKFLFITLLILSFLFIDSSKAISKGKI